MSSATVSVGTRSAGIPVYGFTFGSAFDTLTGIMAETDENLMLRYCQGDERAFEILYLRHKKPLFNYLFRQCGIAAVAEELYHDVWLQLVRHRQRYTPSARFTTYLYHIAHNKIIDHYRRQKHGVPLSFDEDGPALESMPANEPMSMDEHIDRQQALRQLRDLVQQLPEAQREVFLLKEEAGLSLHDIAAVTGVNVETAKSRLRYAHRKLIDGMRGEA